MLCNKQTLMVQQNLVIGIFVSAAFVTAILLVALAIASKKKTDDPTTTCEDGRGVQGECKPPIKEGEIIPQTQEARVTTAGDNMFDDSRN